MRSTRRISAAHIVVRSLRRSSASEAGAGDVITHRKQYRKPDSIRSASTFSARSEALPLLRCAPTFLRYSFGGIASGDQEDIRTSA